LYEGGRYFASQLNSFALTMYGVLVNKFKG
jgi:hypothetical protein